MITTQYPPPALTFAFNLLVKFLTFLSIASWPDHLQCLSLATAFSFGEKISTKYNRKFTEMTVQTVYKVKITLPSLATRRTQWTDLHEILHRGSSRGYNHLFQILCRSVEGFRICVGSNFAILHWLSRSPLTQGYATVHLWLTSLYCDAGITGWPLMALCPPNFSLSENFLLIRKFSFKNMKSGPKNPHLEEIQGQN